MSNAYHNRFERGYTQSYMKLQPPISSLTIGAGVGYPVATRTYRRQNFDQGPPYVGRQFVDTNAYGYRRTRPGGRMASLNADFARTQPQYFRATPAPRPVSRPVSVGRAVTSQQPQRSIPLVDPGPIGKTFARKQRHGYTRNSLGGHWCDFDPTHNDK